MYEYSLNGISILFIMMLVKTSYDYVWILSMWVILILKLQGTLYKNNCATKIATAWIMTARD